MAAARALSRTRRALSCRTSTTNPSARQEPDRFRATAARHDQLQNEQWNGGDLLAAFGVVNLGARVYDPVIGRFLSRDPILQAKSPYAFAGNDPVNRSDPTGMLETCGSGPGETPCNEGGTTLSPADQALLNSYGNKSPIYVSSTCDTIGCTFDRLAGGSPIWLGGSGTGGVLAQTGAASPTGLPATTGCHLIACPSSLKDFVKVSAGF